MTTIGVASICTAFRERTIGTKVWEGYHGRFMESVQAAIASHDWTSGAVPGQAVLALPDAIPYVSCGNRPVEGLDNGDLVARIHRRVPEVYARRAFINPRAKVCSVVIYTRAAYNADPDTVKEGDATEQDYVIVAVLSSCVAPQEGESLPYPPMRLVHNIAGGNKAFWPKTELNDAGEVVYVMPTDSMPEEMIYKMNKETQHDQSLLHRIIGECKRSEEAAERLIQVAD